MSKFEIGDTVITEHSGYTIKNKAITIHRINYDGRSFQTDDSHFPGFWYSMDLFKLTDSPVESAKKLLEKEGFTVIAPPPPPKPRERKVVVYTFSESPEVIHFAEAGYFNRKTDWGLTPKVIEIFDWVENI